MASLASIRRRQGSAIEQINVAGKALFGKEFELPTQGRDRELLITGQLKYIADFLSAKAGINVEEVEPETEPEFVGEGIPYTTPEDQEAFHKQFHENEDDFVRIDGENGTVMMFRKPAASEPAKLEFTEEELRAMTNPVLMQTAKDRGLNPSARLKKDDLVALILNPPKPEE